MTFYNCALTSVLTTPECTANTVVTEYVLTIEKLRIYSAYQCANENGKYLAKTKELLDHELQNLNTRTAEGVFKNRCLVFKKVFKSKKMMGSQLFRPDDRKDVFQHSNLNNIS